MTDINERADRCGYTQFMEEALTFPPAGKFTAPNANETESGKSAIARYRYTIANYN